MILVIRTYVHVKAIITIGGSSAFRNYTISTVAKYYCSVYRIITSWQLVNIGPSVNNDYDYTSIYFDFFTSSLSLFSGVKKGF